MPTNKFQILKNPFCSPFGGNREERTGGDTLKIKALQTVKLCYKKDYSTRKRIHMFPKIKTDNLIIRPFVKSDLIAFTKYRALPSVAKFQSWSNYTYKDALALYEKMNQVPFGTEGNWFQLAIEKKDSPSLAGDLAIHFIDPDQVEVGFTIAPEFQKKSIAFEALMALLEYCFNKLNKHRVIAITDTRNLASCRLLEKVGMRKEGHFIENRYFKGAWGNEFLFAILRSEWNHADSA